MGFPLAVNPSVRSPGLALAVNLLAGVSSPGTAALRGLIMGSKTSAGSITADTQVVQGLAGPDDVSTYCGPGSPAHLAAKAVFAEYGLAQVDLVAPAEAAGNAATQTVIFDDDTGASTIVSVAQTVKLTIAGRVAQIVWGAGVGKVAAATLLVAAINALSADLPVSAANGGGASATVTLTFKLKGTLGNDVLLYLKVSDGTGGSVALTGAAMTGGTTEPTFATALTTVSQKKYDFFLPCIGNTDADLASATSNPGRIKTQLNNAASGFSAKLQQAVVGVTGTLSAAKTGTAQHNFAQFEYLFCNAGQSLPCEFGGAEMGARLREEAADPNVNRIGTGYRATLYAANDLVASTLTDAQVEDALQSGVTPIKYDSSGNPLVSRPITTYFKDTNGNADDRVLDVGRVSGIFAVANDLALTLPQQFPQRKLSADLAPGDDELPDGVTEVRDVKAFVISRLRFWQKRGVVRRDKLDAAIADGTLIVRVNPSDASQCDLVVPLAIVPPLAKFSLVVQKVAQLATERIEGRWPTTN